MNVKTSSLRRCTSCLSYLFLEQVDRMDRRKAREIESKLKYKQGSLYIYFRVLFFLSYPVNHLMHLLL